MYFQIITIVLVALSTITPSVTADCTREGLLAAAALYVSAQTAGTPSTLPQASNFTINENNKAISLSAAVLSKPLKIDLTRSTADTVACASYTMIISSSGKTPYVLATQIRHNGNDTSTISLIDTIAATTSSLFFNASLTLSYIKAEDWSPLNGTLPSRDVLKKAGDAYLDMWTDAKAADTIPWGMDCERVEGSRLTKPCGASFPHGGSAKSNDDRRYVIDETVGSVDVLCAFNSLGDMPDSHEIRLVDGKVKYVHTITV
ncbi:hypothetical protein V8E51_018576 [Hyaloscypha variabilis]